MESDAAPYLHVFLHDAFPTNGGFRIQNYDGLLVTWGSF
jgi:hypothetical protein